MERWGLDTDKFLTVTNIRIIQTEYGRAMILSLLNIGEIWEPEHLKTTYFNPPFYLRPLGMKPCKDNPRKKCRSYYLVFDNGEFLEQIQI